MQDPDAFEEKAHEPEEVHGEAERFQVQKHESTLMFQLSEDPEDPFERLVSLNRILLMAERHLETGGPLFIGEIR